MSFGDISVAGVGTGRTMALAKVEVGSPAQGSAFCLQQNRVLWPSVGATLPA